MVFVSKQIMENTKSEDFHEDSKTDALEKQGKTKSELGHNGDDGHNHENKISAGEGWRAHWDLLLALLILVIDHLCYGIK